MRSECLCASCAFCASNRNALPIASVDFVFFKPFALRFKSLDRRRSKGAHHMHELKTWLVCQMSIVSWINCLFVFVL